MTVAPNTEKIFYAVNDLHPVMQKALGKLLPTTNAGWFAIEGKLKGRFEIIEGYRSPMRQMHLRTHSKSTKAGPWQSAHQYGLAVDFAVAIYEERLVGKPMFRQWSWTEVAPWGKLEGYAEAVGLAVPIKWDRGHVQHPAFEAVRALLKDI